MEEEEEEEKAGTQRCVQGERGRIVSNTDRHFTERFEKISCWWKEKGKSSVIYQVLVKIWCNFGEER